MEIVKFKRQQEQHNAHMNRIRNMTAVLDSSRPESLGLKHLAVRPKKMQLIEDRRQEVARENSKLMGLMTNIMNEKRPQPKHERVPSLNEPVRKRIVDSVNFENRLMMKRLQTVGSVIDNKKLAKDFEHHLQAEQNLRRRQMKPLALPRDLHASSPLRKHGAGDGTDGLFDSSLYASQRGQFLRGSSLESLTADPNAIKSVTDFRKEVIASKKAPRHPNSSTNLSNSQSLHQSLHLGGSLESSSLARGSTIDFQPSQSANHALFEMSHSPAGGRGSY